MEDVSRQVCVRACGVCVRACVCVEVKVQSRAAWPGLHLQLRRRACGERARHWKATLGKVKGSPPNLAQPDQDLGGGPGPGPKPEPDNLELHLSWFDPGPGARLPARPLLSVHSTSPKSQVPCPPSSSPPARLQRRTMSAGLGGAFASCVGEGPLLAQPLQPVR